MASGNEDLKEPNLFVCLLQVNACVWLVCSAVLALIVRCVPHNSAEQPLIVALLMSCLCVWLRHSWRDKSNLRVVGCSLILTAVTCAEVLAEHHDVNATWKTLIWHSNPGVVDSSDPDGWRALDAWYTAYLEHIEKNSLLTPKDLSHKSVTLSFQISPHGEVTDLKVERSGGLEIDEKAKKTIESFPPMQISVPPTRYPLDKRTFVRFSGSPLCWLGPEHPLPLKYLPSAKSSQP